MVLTCLVSLDHPASAARDRGEGGPSNTLVVAALFGAFFWTAPRLAAWWAARGKRPAPEPNAKNLLVWQYAVAVAATVVGVYLALQFSRIDAQKAEATAAATRDTVERRKAIDLLEKATTDLSEFEDDVRDLYWLPDSGGRSLESQLHFSPVEPSRVVDAVLATDPVLGLISRDGYANIRNMQQQVAAVTRLLDAQTGSNAAIRPNLDLLGMTLAIEQHWLGAERPYVAGIWNDDQRNAYGIRWATYELSHDTTQFTWARFRSTPVLTVHGALRTPAGVIPDVDVLRDSVPTAPVAKPRRTAPPGWP